ncbi:MAG TPA: hypothetical protein VFD92_19365 [Candidatus Binatia bacterium]|nr:hypothetical protein [Candidatus Binatia bacterium]
MARVASVVAWTLLAGSALPPAVWAIDPASYRSPLSADRAAQAALHRDWAGARRAIRGPNRTAEIRGANRPTAARAAVARSTGTAPAPARRGGRIDGRVRPEQCRAVVESPSWRSLAAWRGWAPHALAGASTSSHRTSRLRDAASERSLPGDRRGDQSSPPLRAPPIGA